MFRAGCLTYVNIAGKFCPGEEQGAGEARPGPACCCKASLPVETAGGGEPRTALLPGAGGVAMNGLDPQLLSDAREGRQRRRASLEEERRVLDEQLSAFAGFAGMPALTGPSKVPAKGVSKKRPAAGGLGAEPSSKRQRILHERDKRINAIFSQCQTIVKTLSKQKDSIHFNKPVQKAVAKDYYEIVKNPMDLGTVQRKLTHKPEKGQLREYKSPLQFRDDMRLVWANCRLYNHPATVVCQMGERMSTNWEQKWQSSGLEQKWAEELLRQKTEEQVQAAPNLEKLQMSSVHRLTWPAC